MSFPELPSEGFVSHSREETMRLGERFGRMVQGGEFLALYGDLGSGKTTFVKGFANGMGVSETVKSPSYNIYAVYAGAKVSLVHMDAYRLSSPEAFDDLLIDEIVPDPKVLCVEWPEKIAGSIPAGALKISFEIRKDSLHLIRPL